MTPAEANRFCTCDDPAVTEKLQPVVRLVSVACSTTRRPEESMNASRVEVEQDGLAGLGEGVELLRDRVRRRQVEVALEAEDDDAVVPVLVDAELLGRRLDHRDAKRTRI